MFDDVTASNPAAAPLRGNSSRYKDYLYPLAVARTLGGIAVIRQVGWQKNEGGKTGESDIFNFFRPHFFCQLMTPKQTSEIKMKTSGPPELIISGALFFSAMVIFHLDGEIWPGA